MAIYFETKFTLKNGKEVTLRNPKNSDVEAFLKFRKLISEETVFTNQYPEQPEIPEEILIAKWENISNSKSSLILYAFDGEEIIGNMALTNEEPQHPWKKHVAAFGMFILKDYCGNGLGTHLMKIIDDHALVSRIKRIEGYIRATNNKALAMYVKNGFEIEGLRKNTAFINGKMHHEYSIAKLI